MAMTKKISVSVTDEHMLLINEAVGSGDYASASEVIRHALRDWKAKRLIGQLWDEGLKSGRANVGEPIEDIKAEARRRRRPS